MSWEYYISNKNKKELFYLGCGNWSLLPGFNSHHPAVLEYDDPKKIVIDIIDAEIPVSDDTMQFLFRLAEEILEFCGEDEVQMIYDSDEHIPIFDTYRETKDINEIINQVYRG